MVKKIALVHDYIKEYGGAERVLETLHDMYPDAPVFTLVYAPQFLGPHKDRFASWDIRPSFLQFLPFSYKFISIYRLIAPFVFKTFDFSSYDVVIVSATGAYSPNGINVKRGQLRGKDEDPSSHRSGLLRTTKVICYCHTPPRYLYGYATARPQSPSKLVKALTAVMLHVLRMVDYYASRNVDIFVANSQNVAKRIEKFYRRESVVVYPPVDIATSHQQLAISSKKSKLATHNLDASGYYLAGGRLARPKHIDLIVKACLELGVPLKVFGKSFAGYGEELKSIAGLKVEFLGEVSDEERNNLMQHAKAFIFAAEDEDFGIVPVEAMASGIPVIAYASGGVLETVINGKTGVLFDELTVESLTSAIKRCEALRQAQGERLAKACYHQARKFRKEEFVKKIKHIIE